MPTYTEFDSSFSLAMLEEALKNQQIKLVLTEIATRLRNEVLPVLISQEQSGLSPKLGSLAMQHSMGDKFVGALLPEYTAEYLEHIAEGRELLLTTIDNCLRDAHNISTHHDFIALIKAIDGIAFIYDVFETDKANTCNIRQLPDPLPVDGQQIKALLSNKSSYVLCGMKFYYIDINLYHREYDPNVSELFTENYEELAGLFPSDIHEYRQASTDDLMRIAFLTNHKPFHLRCKDYIAPTGEEVDIRARRKDDLLATTYGIGTEIGTDLVLKRNAPPGSCLLGKSRFFILPDEGRTKTWFEKMADQSSAGKPTLPLIASPSNATAKSLMMAQGIDLFLQENGLFDLEKAQIFANCLMAYLVYCGHHSVLEIMEIWNRQLDFVAIERPEQLSIGIIPSEATTLPYIDETDAVERKLPYAIVGNYSNFLHPMYADEVIQRTKTQLEKGLDLRFDNETSAGSYRK